MALRAAVDAGAGGTIVTSVTGTANQITASPTTGAVILSLPVNVQIATSLAIGGATIGTDALAVTGTATFGGTLNSGGGAITFGGQLRSSNASGSLVDTGAASATVPTLIPNRSGATTGIGAQAAGNMSMIVSGVEIGRWTAAGVLFEAATSGVVLKQGANGLCGTFVANGATPVVVNNSNIAITDSIIISLNTIGGTVGVQPHVSAITGSTSFAVTCTAVDTSTYNYAIIKNAA